MSGQLAILAGSGDLPVQISNAQPEAIQIGFHGVTNELPADSQVFRFEQLGALFAYLKKQDVREVVFAGSMTRPPLDPTQFDSVMRDIAPRLIAAMQGGDDSLLRLIINIFEEQGFVVRGAHDLVPDLTCAAGHFLGSKPSEQAMQDMQRAGDILSALSPVDVGQGVVVESGLCLGIEAVQGTDVLLANVAQTAKNLRALSGGVFLKASKRGQDLRVDMPAIGPATIAAVVAARLSGIVIEAGKVMVIDRKTTFQAIEDAGIFFMSRDI